MTLAEEILEKQNIYNKLVDKLGSLLKKQFDIRINITILRILFREAGQNVSELELQIFQQDLEYVELKKIDTEIIRIQRNIELLDQELDTIY